MRLDCSTAQEPLTGRLGPLRHHLVGKTHPARHVRLGAALLGPSAVLPSHSKSTPVSTCPPGLHPLPSHPVSSHLPRLQQLQPQCPPCTVRASRVFTRVLPSWNSQPGTLSRILRSLLPTSFTVSTPAGLPARCPKASAPAFHSFILVNNFFKGFIIIWLTTDFSSLFPPMEHRKQEHVCFILCCFVWSIASPLTLISDECRCVS